MASGIDDARGQDREISVPEARRRLASRPADTEANVGMPAMGVSSDGEERQIIALCGVPNCLEHGVQEVIQEVNVRWPTGRELMGAIVYRWFVCEPHFEALVRGRNVP